MGLILVEVVLSIGWILFLMVRGFPYPKNIRLFNSSFGFTSWSSFEPQLGKSGFYI